MSSVPEAVEVALAASRTDACVAFGVASSAVNVRWANDTATTNGFAETVRLVVIAIDDGRVGVRAGTSAEPAAVEAMVRDAERDAASKAPAFDAAPLERTERDADFDAPAGTTGPDALARVASQLGGAFGAREGRALYGFAHHDARTTWLGTSAGLRRRSTNPGGAIEVSARSPDGTRSVWTAAITDDFADVDVGAMVGHLDTRLAWSGDRIDLPAGRYEVILEPSATADMLLYQYAVASARDADEGRSVFSRAGGGNRIGEKIWPDGVTVYSDPAEPGLACRPFVAAAATSSDSSVFDNGEPIGRTTWIEDGVLRRLTTPGYWARRSGTEPARWTGNLIMAGSGPPLEEMIANTERALLVTCLWYIRAVDPQTLLLTGLTRDGVFLVEDGRVRGAVNNFRFNMSPVDMLRNTVEIGAAERVYPREFGDLIEARVKAPPLRVRDWNMSSVSEAT